MTKKFKQMVHCPECGYEHTVETAWSRWVREHVELESKDGYVFYDIELFPHLYITHTYKTKNYKRKLQFMMIVEVKIHGAEPDSAQRDTLNILGQVIRNRRETSNKKNSYVQIYPTLNKAWSTKSQEWIWLKLFGYHLLQFSGIGPKESDKILWDRKQINITQLIKLLKFELDPDTLRPCDLRIHHSCKKEHFSLFKIKDKLNA